MKNIEKYQSLLASGEVDALLLTSEYNRLYAAQYGVAEGVAVVTKEGAYYFTDSRYIEAAENNLPAFTVRMTHPGSSDIARINEVIGEHTIKKLGFEELDMSYATFLEFQHALHAVLVPMQKKIDAFRASKEPWELELMRKAQEITDLTFTQLQKVICAGSLFTDSIKTGPTACPLTPSSSPAPIRACPTACRVTASFSSAILSRWTSAASTRATART